MNELITYLRDQAYWANQLANTLEAGESIEDMKWSSDLPIEWHEEMVKMHGQMQLNHEIHNHIEKEAKAS